METVVRQWPGFFKGADFGFLNSGHIGSYLLQFSDTEDGMNRFAFWDDPGDDDVGISVLEQLPASFNVGREKGTSPVMKSSSTDAHSTVNPR